MDILINLFIAFGIVVTAYVLLVLGCLAIYVLGFGGTLGDLHLGFFFMPGLKSLVLFFTLVVALPLSVAFIAFYLPPIGRLGIAIGAICVMIGIWLSVAAELEKTMRD